jgi:hypothetical protein
MAANDDGDVGRQGADARGESEHLIGFQCVHPGDAHESGAGVADVMVERAAESQIGERDSMACGFERGGDVFHAERLDAKEWSEAESLVARHRTEEQDVHRQ